LTIVRNMAQFDEGQAEDYKDSINAGSFFGAAAKKVKCVAITGVRVPHPDLGWYWEVTYEFEFNRDGWVKQVLDQGMRSLDPDGFYTYLQNYSPNLAFGGT